MGIHLSKATRRQVIALCDELSLRNSSNPKGVEIASSIQAYVMAKGEITERQRHWLARNAHYQRLQIPDELKGQSINRATEENSTGHDSDSDPLKSLRCIERLTQKILRQVRRQLRHAQTD